MYKVGEVAKLLGINDQTIRVWCKQFADYLSADANPPKGATRDLSENDLRVLRYAQYALNRGATYDQVWSELRDGNALKRFDEVFAVDSTNTEGTPNGGAIVPFSDLLETLGATRGERDYLRLALEDEKQAHDLTRQREAEARERAAIAEEKARGLQEGLTRGEKWQRLTVLLLALLVVVLIIGFVILTFVR